MDQRLSSIDRVRTALSAQGITTINVKQFSESTATAVAAAAAIGTSVERIVKSLVFVAGSRPIMVLASGPNRVDEHKIASLIGIPISRASANQVRQFTGFAVGGVPPVGHSQQIDAFVDQDLMQYDEVWAAAGTPNAVFSIAPRELVRITNGTVADVVQAV